MCRAAVALASALFLGPCVPGWAQQPAAPERDRARPAPVEPASAAGQADTGDLHGAVRVLLDRSGVRDQLQMKMDLTMTMIAALVRPQPPQELLEELGGDGLLDEILDAAVEVFAKHFTHQQVADMIEFWNSPTGRALREKQPVIATEMTMTGAEIGKRRAEEVLRKLQERGYKRVAE